MSELRSHVLAQGLTRPKPPAIAAASLLFASAACARQSQAAVTHGEGSFGADLDRGERPPTLAEWRRARARLDMLRRESARAGSRTMHLSLALREPYTGKVMEARGAVAIDPPSAMRMILLGPGGTT